MNSLSESLKFTISGTSDIFWNKNQFFEFLLKNQKQSIELTVVPEAICLDTLGVYEILDMFEFESVTILTWNPLESHPKYNVNLIGHNYCFDFCARHHTKIHTELHNWDLKYTFMCLYHRPTASKLGMASYAEQYSSLIHFSIDTSPDNLNQFEFNKLLNYDVASMVRASQLIQTMPKLIAPSDHYSGFNFYDFSDLITSFYKSIFVDLVGENHVLGNTFFPSEKTIRPILLKKPFIVFASKNFLEYLRQMGFRTFSDFWDEEYDGFDQGDRLKRIYKTIDYIGSLSKHKLKKMYWDMQYTLDHNYNLLTNQKFKRSITKI